MLQLLLTPHDGGTAWRHALAPGEARAGWESVGPYGLAKRVGRLLGFPAEPAAAPERVAAFVARLDRDDDGKRAYSASRQADPFGVASFLLGARDRLRLAGWTGAALAGSDRLADVSRLEARPEPLPPGLPDLLARLAAELRRAGRVPAQIAVTLSAPREAFAPLVLALLDALAAAGATVTGATPDAPLAPAGTDLGRLQRALVDPRAPAARLSGDGSVLLLEADTALEAAELCSDFLRGGALDATTLLAAAEPDVLDAALVRQGLPAVGLSVASRLRPHLQVLPLRLALAFSPQEPFRAAELLVLPGGPLPGFARARLLDALGEMPGVWSPAWRDAVAAIGQEAARRARESDETEADAAAEGARLRERIDAWFGGELADAGVGLPVPRAAAIARDVAAWLRSRAAPADRAARGAATPGANGDAGRRGGDPHEPAERGEDAAPWAHAAAVARTFERMLLSRPPGERLRPVALMQLHALAVGAGSERAPWPAQAGRPAVALLAADVLPGARRVIWWGFVQDVEVGDAPDAWSEPERAALAAAGVTLPAPGAARAVEAWSWRRVVLAARDGVAFVRWRLSGAEVLQPHPFLDELETRAAGGSLAACTVGSEAALAGRAAPWPPRTVAVDPARPIRPRTLWRVPGIALSGTQSATQLRALLGCPFHWALEYAGDLRPGRALDLPEGSQLLGDFAHRLLQDLLLGPERLSLDSATEADARARVERAFDARVATEAAPLVLRGSELERERGRRLVGRAAAALVRHLRAGDWVPVAAEQELAGEFQGHPLAGFADLVVERRRDGARAVIDLKLSGFDYRRTELESGRGLQLALYASMLGGGGGRLPPAAYLILQDGELLTVTPQAFPGGVAVEGPSLEESLSIAGGTLALWRKAFEAGWVPATMRKSGWEDDVAAIVGPIPGPKDPGRYPPQCEFCRFTALCRVQLGAEELP
ncbi:MAG TPA: PD-(D/E)XK nuclease family protein [Anaeromyxobacter sp.]|nr:PD-(D/E)XK nuclease family protein [Anaeromyxobacter sp.]